MSAGTIKLVVIGLGLMGSKHVELVQSHPRCELVGVCDVDAATRPIADKANVPHFQDVEELLDQTDPDGAIIATPSAHHAEAFEACALRKIHALIEKPVADTTDAARRIAELADTTGTRALVGHHRRHNPLIKESHAIVNSGEIGRLVAASMMWTLMKPDEYFRVNWRTKQPDGGLVLINLVHELDILRHVCGEIEQVFAQSRSAARGYEVEDSVSISLSFQNGTVGTIIGSDATAAPWSYEATTSENSLYSHVLENSYHFLGTEGSLAFPKMELWKYPDENPRGWQYPMEKAVREVVRADSLTNQLDHFCDVIEGTQLPLIDAWDGGRSLAAALAVLESSATNLPVRPVFGDS